MRRSVLIVLSSMAALSLVACSGDDTFVPPPSADASGDATSKSDALAPSEDASASDAGGPRFALLTYTPDFSTSQYLAVDLTDGVVAGSLSYMGGGTNVTATPNASPGTDPAANTSPWVLEQDNDVVLKMTGANPAAPIASFSVASSTDASGFFAAANPYAVAEVGTKAYVALFNRNAIAVLDISQPVDGGTPTAMIDLSSLVQDGGDGNVEAMALAYDASRQRLWVVLANLDEGSSSSFLACDAQLKSEVVAISTATNTLVPDVVYPLTGYNPVSVAYDETGDRLLVMNGGCNQAEGDGGKGALAGADVEQIALATGASTVLLDTTTQGGYGQLVYADAHHAFLAFGPGAAYAWDPTTTLIGAALPNAPDAFTWDGRGLLGPKQQFLADGGMGTIDLVEVDPTTGVSTTIASNLVTPTGGYWEGVDVWPRP